MRVDIDIDGQMFSGSHGGSFADECGVVDDFGIAFGMVSVSGIKRVDLVKMAVEVVNHLIINEVEFEFGFCDITGQKEFKEVLK